RYQKAEVLDGERDAEEEERQPATLGEGLEGQQEEQDGELVETPGSHRIERPTVQAPEGRTEQTEQWVASLLRGEVQQERDPDVGKNADAPPQMKPALVLMDPQFVRASHRQIEERKVRGMLRRRLVRLREMIVRVRVVSLCDPDAVSPDVIDVGVSGRRRLGREPGLAQYQQCTEEDGHAGKPGSSGELAPTRAHMTPRISSG